MTYYLGYYNDTLAAGGSLTFPKDGIHRLFTFIKAKPKSTDRPSPQTKPYTVTAQPR